MVLVMSLGSYNSSFLLFNQHTCLMVGMGRKLDFGKTYAWVINHFGHNTWIFNSHSCKKYDHSKGSWLSLLVL